MLPIQIQKCSIRIRQQFILPRTSDAMAFYTVFLPMDDSTMTQSWTHLCCTLCICLTTNEGRQHRLFLSEARKIHGSLHRSQHEPSHPQKR